MDMKKLCSDADTVLELLYNTYYEHICTDDTDEIKQAFDDLYNALSDKTLKEKDAIIDLVCDLLLATGGNDHSGPGENRQS